MMVRANEPTQERILGLNPFTWYRYEELEEMTGRARGTIAEALNHLIRKGKVRKNTVNHGRGRPISLFMVIVNG